MNLVEFNTTVEEAEKTGNEWHLTLRKSLPGATKDMWWRETFDAVVVASGHYSIPHIPTIPGMVEYDKKYPGRIQHSKHYQTPEQYRNQVSRNSRNCSMS